MGSFYIKFGHQARNLFSMLLLPTAIGCSNLLSTLLWSLPMSLFPSIHACFVTGACSPHHVRPDACSVIRMVFNLFASLSRSEVKAADPFKCSLAVALCKLCEQAIHNRILPKSTPTGRICPIEPCDSPSDTHRRSATQYPRSEEWKTGKTGFVD